MRNVISRVLRVATVTMMLGGLAFTPVAVAAKAAGLPAGRAFTASLLAKAPVPGGAQLTSSFSSPLAGNGEFAGAGVFDLHHDYYLKSATDLAAFLRSHRLAGSVLSAPSTSSGSDIVTTTTFAMSFPFANRHVSLEQVTYAVGLASNGEQELRIDALVDWEPVRTVVMPIKGVVTLTIYRKLSLVMRSSDPATIVLSHKQALAVRSDIESLSNTNSGFCMEDSTMYMLRVAPKKGAPATWTASGEECPNNLYVGTGANPVRLSNASCTLNWYVASLFPGLTSNDTVKSLKDCAVATE